MGQSDIAVKQWLRDKKRFADLFNGTVFQGKQVVLPEELEELDSEAGIIVEDKAKKEKGVQRYRDITMRWRKGPLLAVLACENQEKIHYAMPVRMMLYDSLSYVEQIRQLWKSRDPEEKLTEEEFLSRFRREDKIYPVISLLFYYGETVWDGSRDLYGMFRREELFREQKGLEAYVPNYSLNLIDAGNIKDIEKFRTDLQLIFGMLQYKGKTDGMKEYLEAHREYFEHVDLETYQAMRELLHSKMQLKEFWPGRNRKETVNVCTALEALYNNGVNDGIKQGIEQGMELMRKIFKLHSQGRTVEEIAAECGLAAEKVKEMLD